MKRFEICYVELMDSGCSVQKGLRPCLIASNDVACKHSPVIVVVPITTAKKSNIPTHMNIMLKKPSTILFEQFISIAKDRIGNKIGELPKYLYGEAENKMQLSLGISKS